MKTSTLLRVPWTCRWGRFGVAIEGAGAAGSRVDDVFWACHHPERAPELRLTKRRECESCAFWEAAAQFAATGVKGCAGGELPTES